MLGLHSGKSTMEINDILLQALVVDLASEGLLVNIEPDPSNLGCLIQIRDILSGKTYSRFVEGQGSLLVDTLDLMANEILKDMEKENENTKA